MLTPGSANPIPHLWFVVTEPDAVTRECAVVSLTILRQDKDRTVVLAPADHSFINHPSVVHYSGALIVNADRLVALLLAGTIQPSECCSPDVLKLVQQGINASPFTPSKVIRLTPCPVCEFVRRRKPPKEHYPTGFPFLSWQRKLSVHTTL